MAGEAKSDAFMLGTATIMLGALADLMNLNDENSIGLVKNVVIKTTPGFTDLSQGVQNSLIYSVMTSNTAVVNGEMYEYTAKNLTYSAGLDGSAVTETNVKTTLGTAVVAPVGPSTEGSKILEVADTEGFEANDFAFVQIANTDQVMVRKVASVQDDVSITLVTGLPFALPVGTVVHKVKVIPIGSTGSQPFLACKIVGRMANGDPVAMLIPKVRVASGLSLGFKTDNFDNMPMELQVFDQVGTDPFFNMFQSVGANGFPAKAMLLAS
jgi:hypothetical protein